MTEAFRLGGYWPQLVDQWLDYVVEPGRVISVFKCQMNFTTQLAEDLLSLGSRFQSPLEYELAASIEDGNRDG